MAGKASSPAGRSVGQRGGKSSTSHRRRRG